MALQGKRVLVTGGSGFIGSHLTRRLVELGADVYVLVKYNSVVDNVRIAGLWDRVTPVEADIRNADSLRRLREIRPEIIFHLAAYNHVGDSFFHVSEAVDSNSKGTVNVLEAYDEYDRFIYISTSEVYGHQERLPFQEDSFPHPRSPYAVGKYAGEMYARMKWISESKPVVVVRPFNAYGPYQSPRAVTAELIIACLRGDDVITTEGYQTREFNFVGDLVEGFILAADSPNAVGEIINLGCGEETRIRDRVEQIHELSQSTSRLRIGELAGRPGEILRMVADNSKAADLLGWSPKIGSEQGLTTTIDWYRRFLEQFGDANSPIAQLGL
jgi:nucleoside-diphosphate-sugar epimerase